MTASKLWMADVAISMPKAPTAQRPVVHDLSGGFGLTTFGITLNLSEADRDEILSGFYAPPGQGVKVPRGR